MTEEIAARRKKIQAAMGRAPSLGRQRVEP